MARGYLFGPGTLVLLVIMLIGCGQAESPASASAALTQVAYVKAPAPGDGDQFGAAVAVSADGITMAVGAPGEGSAARAINGDQANNEADDSGAVYVYTRSNGTWSPQAFVKASNADSLDQFGTNVALSADGNTLVVGAFFEDGGARGVNGNQADNTIGQAGAVYVFARRGTTWTQQAYLEAALRRPGAPEQRNINEARPVPKPVAAPVEFSGEESPPPIVPEEPQARTADPAKSRSVLDSLEEEMASLLGRPPEKT